MPFPRLNPYTPASTTSTSGSANTATNNAGNNVKIKNSKKSKLATDRPLPRAIPQGNFNIDYTTFEVKIPNYVFGKAIELAGAGGLIAISLGRRCVCA